MLKRFGGVEGCSFQQSVLSLKEMAVIDHFNTTHCRDESGRLVISLPIKADAATLGESRSLTVKKCLFHKLSHRAKGEFEDFTSPMEECF